MADFPNLNMSIGEYYQMLKDGKRPTRSRTSREEGKQVLAEFGGPLPPPPPPLPTLNSGSGSGSGGKGGQGNGKAAQNLRKESEGNSKIGGSGQRKELQAAGDKDKNMIIQAKEKEKVKKTLQQQNKNADGGSGSGSSGHKQQQQQKQEQQKQQEQHQQQKGKVQLKELRKGGSVGNVESGEKKRDEKLKNKQNEKSKQQEQQEQKQIKLTKSGEQDQRQGNKKKQTNVQQQQLSSDSKQQQQQQQIQKRNPQQSTGQSPNVNLYIQQQKQQKKDDLQLITPKSTKEIEKKSHKSISQQQQQQQIQQQQQQIQVVQQTQKQVKQQSQQSPSLNQQTPLNHQNQTPSSALNSTQNVNNQVTKESQQQLQLNISTNINNSNQQLQSQQQPQQQTQQQQQESKEQREIDEAFKDLERFECVFPHSHYFKNRFFFVDKSYQQQQQQLCRTVELQKSNQKIEEDGKDEEGNINIDIDEQEEDEKLKDDKMKSEKVLKEIVIYQIVQDSQGQNNQIDNNNIKVQGKLINKEFNKIEDNKIQEFKIGLISVIGKVFQCKMGNLMSGEDIKQMIKGGQCMFEGQNVGVVQILENEYRDYNVKEQSLVQENIQLLKQQQIKIDKDYINEKRNQLKFGILILIENYFKIIEIKFKENFNFIKDLKELDFDKYSNLLQQNQSKNGDTQIPYKLLKLINESVSNYIENTSEILVNKDNLSDMLFTLCKFEQSNQKITEQQQNLQNQQLKEAQQKYIKLRQGILLHIRYDKQAQDFALLFRITLCKTCQREKTEWVFLQQSRIKADLSKGYVSIEFMQNLDNVPSTFQKIKIKNIEFISRQSFEIDQIKSLNDYLNDQFQQKDPKKERQIEGKEKCGYCKYNKEGLEVVKCDNCCKVFHLDCIKSKNKSYLQIGQREKTWRCQNCLRCSNCLSLLCVNYFSSLLCQVCNSPYHYDCLEQTFKLSVPFNFQSQQQQQYQSFQTDGNKSSPMKDTLVLQYNDFKCEHCVICQNCGSREAGRSKLNKWSKDFTLCSTCNKKKKNKQFCPICESFWPQTHIEILETPTTLFTDEMIKCIHCNMFIHYDCDRIFQQNGVKEFFIKDKLTLALDSIHDSSQKQFQQSILNDLQISTISNNLLLSQQYNCADCRQNQRSQLIHQIIEKLESEDKNKIFMNPVEKQIINYTKIIKNPMCFQYIRQQMGQYLRNPEQLKSDINLMYQNALNYNQPNTKVFKIAFKLKESSGFQLNEIFRVLERNKFKTMDEDLFREFIRKQVKQLRTINNQLQIENQQNDQVENEQIQQQSAQKDQSLLNTKLSFDVVDRDENVEMKDQLQNKVQQIKFNLELDQFYDPNEFQFQQLPSQNNKQQQYQLFKENNITIDNIEMDLEQLQQQNEHSDHSFFGTSNNPNFGYGNSNQEKVRLRKRKDINYNEDKILSNNNLQGDKQYPQVGSKRSFKLMSGGQNQSSIGGGDELQQMNTKGKNKNFASLQHQQSANLFDSIALLNSNYTPSIQNHQHHISASLALPPNSTPAVSTFQHQPPHSNTLLQQHQQSLTTNNNNNNGKPSLNQHSSRTDILLQAIQKQKQIDDSELTAHQQLQLSQNNLLIKHQMMMNYYQEIDDEKCYYSNPSRCSYLDPSLIFEEMCYLCGSFGNREDFLCCTLCGESFHTYCLSLPNDDIQKFQQYWKCLNCKFCEICSSAINESLLLYCDVCDKAFHSYCLRPKLKVIPKCGWKCGECFQCGICGGRQFFSETEMREQRNLEVMDFSASNNFQFCYSCGVNEYKRSFCKICNQKNNNQQDQSQYLEYSDLSTPLSPTKDQRLNSNLMMKCSVCAYYSHLRCSRVSLPTILLLQSPSTTATTTTLLQSHYKCLPCLLQDRSINFLIRESCELYQNIHQIINRQKLLTVVCGEMLRGYFPVEERAGLFIKNFIDQNQEWFRKERCVGEWLEVMECEVCYDWGQGGSGKGNQIEVKGIEGEGETEERKEEDGEEVVIDMDIDEEKEDGKDKSEEKEQDKLKLNQQILLEEQLDKPHRAPLIKKWTNEVDFSDVHLQQHQEYQNKILQDHNYSANSIQDNPHLQKLHFLSDHLYSHKQSFLPQKRNLYKSLFYGDLYQFEQKDQFVHPFDIIEKITVPTNEVLKRVNFAEEMVKREFKAVMKVKTQFFKWFEDMIKGFLKNNQKYINKGMKQKQPQSTDSLQQIQQADTINRQHNSNQSIVQYQSSKDQQQQQQNQPGLSLNNAKQSAYQHQPSLSQLSTTTDLCTLDDLPVSNPQLKLTCYLCHLKGEYLVTGRLIPYQINLFAHTNCVLFSKEVTETEDGQLQNFFHQQLYKCCVCGEKGATVECFGRKCHLKFHFPCAYRGKRVAFLRSKETYCEGCARGKDVAVGLSGEYQVRRRLYIVKNLSNTNEVGGVGGNGQGVGGGQGSGGQGNGGNNGDGEGKEKNVQIDKWRPYYYDMFNRVGNLTVLSLKKEINQIIDEDDEQESKQITDFATVRIYWKFFVDQNLQIEDTEKNSQKIKKTYFLCSNNMVREIQKNDLQVLFNFTNDRIKPRIVWSLTLQEKKSQINKLENNDQMMVDNNGDENNNNNNYIARTQTDFWQKIYNHFQKERPNFSLQNIEFSIQEFAGKTKYPISIWNRVEVKNKDFFIKKGSQALSSIYTFENDQQNQSNSNNQGMIGGSGGILGIMGNDLNISQDKHKGVLTQDDVFKRMLKINQMNEILQSQNNSAIFQSHGGQIKKFCSKFLNYEDISKLLGKKIIFSQQNKKKQAEQNVSRLTKKQRTTQELENSNKKVDLPIAMKFRISKNQPKKVEVGPSLIHRNGLFTLEDLIVGDIVIEYVGEKIRNAVADKREQVYNKKGVGDCYLFRLDKDTIVDATYKGNKARYLNHSCDASCAAKIIPVQGLKHIVILANKNIKAGEELTYNYNFDIESDKISCYCGAPNCLGRLN